MTDDKIFVIAGTEDEYFQYYNKTYNDNEHSRTTFYRLKESKDLSYLRGVHYPTGVFVGTWRTLPDISDIVNALLICSNWQNTKLKEIRDSLDAAKNLVVYYNGVVQHPSEYVVAGDTVTLFNNSNSMINAVLQTKYGHMSEFIIAPNSNIRAHYDKI